MAALNIYGSFLPSPLCPVVRLLSASRPLAVFFVIPFIIVLAVKSKIGWAFSHVLNKVIETFQPSLAYCDSPTAISFIKLTGRIVASLPHTIPYMIGSSSAMRAFSMSGVGFHKSLKPFGERASTTTSMAATQIGSVNGCGIAAIAKAVPFEPASGSKYSGRKYSEPTENLAFHRNASASVSVSPILHTVYISILRYDWGLI